jgi:DNA topoisomerase-6 subunit B
LNTAPKIARNVFTTSRLAEFASVSELTKQVGSEPDRWPLIIVKELVDDALDACEESGVPPVITVEVSTRKGTISVADNGPGIDPTTVERIIDFQKKTSNREAFVGPTRGQQGNALQTILAMPFALDGTEGQTVIEARRIAHRITFTIDVVRREPRIGHVQDSSVVQNGTRITVQWPLLLTDH